MTYTNLICVSCHAVFEEKDAVQMTVCGELCEYCPECMCDSLWETDVPTAEQSEAKRQQLLEMQAMSAQLETLADDPIDIALSEQALALAKLRLRWTAIKDFYWPIINAFHRLGLEPRLTTTSIDISFAGDAHKLASVVRILRGSGFNTTMARPKKGDTSWHAFYNHPDCETPVWLYFTSSVCRQVKVGTRMVEQDIYEVRCGDISGGVEPEALPPPVAIVPALEADELSF